MHTVNVLFKNSSITISFVYREASSAQDVFEKIKNATEKKVDFADDFGAKASVEVDQIAAMTSTDFSKDMDKNGELSIIQAKANLRTQTLAKNDVGLQLLNTAANGNRPNQMQ